MSDRYVLSAYWGNRKESSRSCAERLSHCLKAFASIDALLQPWFELGRSRKDALARQIRPDVESLEALFLKGRNRRDNDRSVIEELGFSLDLWNGASEAESVGLVVRCGSYATMPPNSCVVKLPPVSGIPSRLFGVSLLIELLSAIARAWEPDWGVVVSRFHRDQLNERSGVPIVGWMTYLSAARGAVPALPPPANVVEVDGKGWIIVAVPETFSVDNRSHIEAARVVSEQLNAADLLRPTQAVGPH